MTSLGLTAFLQVLILAPARDTYSEAYRLTTKTGRPMVVMVGAEWCAACQTMEQNVIPQVRRRGRLGKVAFAIVDLDRQRELGRKLTRGGPIPQLLMYRKTPDGWMLSRLTGGQSVPAVESFIEAGLKRHAASKKMETTQKERSANKSEGTREGGSDGKVRMTSHP